MLPQLHKNVNCLTKDDNILDQVYTDITRANKAAPSPYLGLSDHTSMIMTPAYKPVVCRSKHIKMVQVWSEEAAVSLQVCSGSTD